MAHDLGDAAVKQALLASARRKTVPVLAGLAHHSDDLLDPRRISRIPHALVVRRATGQVSGQRDRGASPSGGVDQGSL
jgi:hypothetical protein